MTMTANAHIDTAITVMGEPEVLAAEEGGTNGVANGNVGPKVLVKDPL